MNVYCLSPCPCQLTKYSVLFSVELPALRTVLTLETLTMLSEPHNKDLLFSNVIKIKSNKDLSLFMFNLIIKKLTIFPITKIFNNIQNLN